MNCGKTLCACKVCVPSLFSHVELFVIPWTVAHQAPLSMGFSHQGNWSGLPFPPPGYLPNPGLKLLHFRNWQVNFLPLSHLGIPIYGINTCKVPETYSLSLNDS